MFFNVTYVCTNLKTTAKFFSVYQFSGKFCEFNFLFLIILQLYLYWDDIQGLSVMRDFQILWEIRPVGSACSALI